MEHPISTQSQTILALAVVTMVITMPVMFVIFMSMMESMTTLESDKDSNN